MLGRQRRQAPDVAPKVQLDKLRDVQPRDIVVRFALGATISILAALLGEAFSPRFGDAFLAFPAILPASLTLIQEKEGTRRADRDAIGAAVGGIGLVVFGTIGETALGRIAPIIAIIAALVGWTLTAFGLYALLAFLCPESCDRNND